AKNSLENFQMALDMAIVGIGTGINQGFMGVLDDVGEALVKLEEDGVFKAFGEMLSNLALVAFPELESGVDGAYNGLVELGAVALDVAQAITNFKMNVQDIGNVVKWLW